MPTTRPEGSSTRRQGRRRSLGTTDKQCFPIRVFSDREAADERRKRADEQHERRRASAKGGQQRWTGKPPPALSFGPWEKATAVVAEQSRKLRRRALLELTETASLLARDFGHRCPDCGTAGEWDSLALTVECRSKSCKENRRAAGLDDSTEEHRHERGAVVCPKCSPLAASRRHVCPDCGEWSTYEREQRAAICPRCGQLLARVLSFSRVPRVSQCGRESASGPVVLEVVEHARGGARARASVRRCNSGWRCPHCAQIAQKRSAREVHACVLGYLGARPGHRAYLVTLTLAHNNGHELEDLRRGVTGAFRRLLQGREAKLFRRRFGAEAYVRALEVTHGANGWHPHVHALIFVRRELKPKRLERLRRWYAARWCDALAEQGYQASDEIGVRVDAADKAGRYLTKMGLLDLTAELAMGGAKTGRCSECGKHQATHWSNGRRFCDDCGAQVNRTPWQILSDWHEHKTPRDRRLWLTYYREIAGARRLTWSRWPDEHGRPVRLRERYIPKQELLALGRVSHRIAVDPTAWRSLPAAARASALDACELGDIHALEAAVGIDNVLPAPVKFDPNDQPLDPRDIERRAAGKLTFDERRELHMALPEDPAARHHAPRPIIVPKQTRPTNGTLAFGTTSPPTDTRRDCGPPVH